MVKHLQFGRPRFNPWVRKIPWRRKWQCTPVLLPEKFHGGRSLVGYSPWCLKESDMTEQLRFQRKTELREKKRLISNEHLDPSMPEANTLRTF